MSISKLGIWKSIDWSFINFELLSSSWNISLQLLCFELSMKDIDHSFLLRFPFWPIHLNFVQFWLLKTPTYHKMWVYMKMCCNTYHNIRSCIFCVWPKHSKLHPTQIGHIETFLPQKSFISFQFLPESFKLYPQNIKPYVLKVQNI